MGRISAFKTGLKKGIRPLIDITDERGNFYQCNELKSVYNIHGTFLDYQSLLQKIPERWKNVLNDNKITCILTRFNVRCNVYVKYLLNGKKGCRLFYDILASSTIFQGNTKWEQELINMSDEEWERHNKVISSLKEVKLKDFQYKITNKILVTKSFLYRINKADDNLCQYCQQHSETIIHLFVHCHVVRRFWSTLQGWLLNNFGLRMLLTGKNIMFPSERRGGLTNYLYVVAKYYIYANKFSGYELHI